MPTGPTNREKTSIENTSVVLTGLTYGHAVGVAFAAISRQVVKGEH